ncbi:MAG: acyl-CoA thioesterase [Rhizobiaceae bacterium]|nr:acyl-CoA thioesterase [Rhizobiaceae bacterium]
MAAPDFQQTASAAIDTGLAHMTPPRLDRALLDSAIYPMRHDIQTRVSDLDIQQHVNNVAVLGLMEEGRARFFRDVDWYEKRGALRAVVAGLQVEYAFELRYPQPVQIFTGVIAIGRSSFTLAQVLRQGSAAGAYSVSTVVVLDGTRAAPMPDLLRELLRTASVRIGDGVGQAAP